VLLIYIYIYVAYSLNRVLIAGLGLSIKFKILKCTRKYTLAAFQISSFRRRVYTRCCSPSQQEIPLCLTFRTRLTRPRALNTNWTRLLSALRVHFRHYFSPRTTYAYYARIWSLPLFLSFSERITYYNIYVRVVLRNANKFRDTGARSVPPR
jgi:hypothetical protein